jgi:ArsR family transcriptional regulator
MKNRANSCQDKSCDSLSPPREDGSAEQLARLAWAIAHPARVRILQLLSGRRGCVCGELVAQLPLAQSTVSQHLKILKEMGLIQGTVDGPRVCYCIDRGNLKRLKKLVAAL